MPAWSGYWNDVFKDGRPPLAQSNTINRELSRIYRRPGMRNHKALLNALIGATPGGNATATYKRIQSVRGIDDNGNSVDLGGKRPLETVTVINRVTTAGDVTVEKAIVNWDSTFTRVVDKSGNGAGGQLGY